MLTTLLKIYGKLRHLWDKPNLSELPDNLRQMDLRQYETKINSYQYKSDGLSGLLDKTSSITHFLDYSVEDNRDCDDYARMWSAWLVYNGYKATEVIVTNPSYFLNKAHVVTIGEKDGKFFLCNYDVYGPFDTFESAMDYMKKFKSYPKYIYAKYRSFEPIN